jgi:hypothetical protein
MNTVWTPAELRDVFVTSGRSRRGYTVRAHLIAAACVEWRKGQPEALRVYGACGWRNGFSTPSPRTMLCLGDDYELCDECAIDGHPGASHVVYRFADSAGRPIYIGKATNFISRIGQHYTTSPWWDLVAGWTLDPQPSDQAAVDAEARAIRAEVPRFNQRMPLLPEDRAYAP